METEEQGANPIEEAAPAAYCRECGKPLQTEEIVEFDEAAHCAECVQALEAHRAPEPAPAQKESKDWASGHVSEEAYNPRPYSEPIDHNAPNPVLALLLGLIPGVGAVYNGQYAKAVVHVITLGGLLGAASSADDGPTVITVFLIMLMFFYMPVEAFRTAQALRKGEAVDEFSGLVKKGPAPSLTLGIALVVAGVVFLLHTLGLVSLGDLQNFWPVVLIVVGVRMLVDRYRASSNSEMRYPFAGEPASK